MRYRLRTPPLFISGAGLIVFGLLLAFGVIAKGRADVLWITVNLLGGAAVAAYALYRMFRPIGNQ